MGIKLEETRGSCWHFLVSRQASGLTIPREVEAGIVCASYPPSAKRPVPKNKSRGLWLAGQTAVQDLPGQNSISFTVPF